MGVKAVDLRRGMGVQYDGQTYVVFSSQHVAKGNKRSYMQIELKNAKTGQIKKDRFRVDDQLEEAFFERKAMAYLYSEGKKIILMDGQTYEQAEIPIELLGDKAVYLTADIELELAFVEGQPISAELPNTVELKIVDTPPQVKGATATNQLKEAICEGGAKIKVPPFVENGTVVKVDTRTCEYLGRA